MDNVTSLNQRRAAFINLISAYSEDRWAASWPSGIQDEIRRDRGIWLAIATTTGWPIGYRAEDGWEELTDDEWRAYLAMAAERGDDAAGR